MQSNVNFYFGNAVDGYRVMRSDFYHKIELHVGFYLNGDLQGFGERSTLVVSSFCPPTVDGLHEIARLEPVLQAVCSYLNTGGVLRNLQKALQELSEVVADTAVDTAGWKYIQNVIPQTGVHMRHESGKHAVWLEPKTDMTCGDIVILDGALRDYPQWRVSEILSYIANTETENEITRSLPPPFDG